jgi:DNA-directed RNA polymerase subunit M/transcription elongation factor TFIIS
MPVLPRSSGDTLGRKDSGRETCRACGNLRTYFTTNCRNCGAQFPDDGLRSRNQATANNRQAGECPKCGSTIHYDTEKKSIWCCADCGEKYRAPKPTESK